LKLISDIFRRRQIDEFARSMAEKFEKRLPTARFGDVKRRTAELEILTGHIQGFQRKEALGMYGKSRLVNTLRWAMLDRGYDEQVVGQYCFELAQKIATPKPPQSG
jgi:hypothetical protein